jgi:hypothetical protein
VQIREQRFVGARADERGALAAALSGAVEQSPEIFDHVAAYLLGAYATRDIDLNAHQGLVVAGGELYAYPQGIQKELELRTLKQVQDALKPFLAGGRKQIRIGKNNLRLWPLSVDSLFTGLRFGDDDYAAVSACVGKDTIDRRRAAGYKD